MISCLVLFYTLYSQSDLAKISLFYRKKRGRNIHHLKDLILQESKQILYMAIEIEKIIGFFSFQYIAMMSCLFITYLLLYFSNSLSFFFLTLEYSTRNKNINDSIGMCQSGDLFYSKWSFFKAKPYKK